MISVDESFSCKFVCYFLCRVRDYIATGIATRLVDPDGGRQHVGPHTEITRVLQPCCCPVTTGLRTGSCMVAAAVK